MIYFDNAATTLRKPPEVIDAVVQAMTTMGNAQRGVHESALTASRTVYEARLKLAKLFDCPREDHVIFTSNATEALNIAINGVIERGDHVISTDLEHNSVLRPLYRLEREQGVELDFVRADKNGTVCYDDFAWLMRPNTKAVVCTHASNLTGNKLDIAKIAKIAHEHGTLIIVDGSQTAGTSDISMQDMGIDILCCAGHKGLLGPQGTGVLCVREGLHLRPWKVGGSGVQSYRKEHPEDYPTCLEAGTLNGHGIAGLSAAADWLEQTGPDVIRRHENELMRRFYDAVRHIDGVTVYGDFSDDDRSAIVALNIRDYDSAAVADELFEQWEISVRPGAHCAPRMHQALGTEEQGAVRFSFGWYNTADEVDIAIEAVRELARP